MEELLEEILAQYDLEVDKIVRTRGGWLLYTDAGLCMLREGQQKAEGFEFTRNVREYLETVFHDPDFVSDLIDSGDGVLVSKRIH